MSEQLPAKATEASTKAAKQRIPKRVRHACDLLLSGKCATVTAAAERAGLSREHLSRSMRLPHIRQYLERESRETIDVLKVRATAVLELLLDAGSEHVRLDAAKHVLALNGIRPPDREGVNVNINVTPGYVIDLSEPASGGAPVLNGTAVRVDSDANGASDPQDMGAE